MKLLISLIFKASLKLETLCVPFAMMMLSPYTTGHTSTYINQPSTNTDILLTSIQEKTDACCIRHYGYHIY